MNPPSPAPGSATDRFMFGDSVVFLNLRGDRFRISSRLICLFPDSLLTSLFPSGYIPFCSITPASPTTTSNPQERPPATNTPPGLFLDDPSTLQVAALPTPAPSGAESPSSSKSPSPGGLSSDENAARSSISRSAALRWRQHYPDNESVLEYSESEADSDLSASSEPSQACTPAPDEHERESFRNPEEELLEGAFSDLHEARIVNSDLDPTLFRYIAYGLRQVIAANEEIKKALEEEHKKALDMVRRSLTTRSGRRRSAGGSRTASRRSSRAGINTAPPSTSAAPVVDDAHEQPPKEGPVQPDELAAALSAGNGPSLEPATAESIRSSSILTEAAQTAQADPSACMLPQENPPSADEAPQIRNSTMERFPAEPAAAPKRSDLVTQFGITRRISAAKSAIVSYISQRFPHAYTISDLSANEITPVSVVGPSIADVPATTTSVLTGAIHAEPAALPPPRPLESMVEIAPTRPPHPIQYLLVLREDIEFYAIPKNAQDYLPRQSTESDQPRSAQRRKSRRNSLPEHGLSSIFSTLGKQSSKGKAKSLPETHDHSIEKLQRHLIKNECFKILKSRKVIFPSPLDSSKDGCRESPRPPSADFEPHSLDDGRSCEPMLLPPRSLSLQAPGPLQSAELEPQCSQTPTPSTQTPNSPRWDGTSEAEARTCEHNRQLLDIEKILKCHAYCDSSAVWPYRESLRSDSYQLVSIAILNMKEKRDPSVPECISSSIPEHEHEHEHGRPHEREPMRTTSLSRSKVSFGACDSSACAQKPDSSALGSDPAAGAASQKGTKASDNPGGLASSILVQAQEGSIVPNTSGFEYCMKGRQPFRKSWWDVEHVQIRLPPPSFGPLDHKAVAEPAGDLHDGATGSSCSVKGHRDEPGHTSKELLDQVQAMLSEAAQEAPAAKDLRRAGSSKSSTHRTQRSEEHAAIGEQPDQSTGQKPRAVMRRSTLFGRPSEIPTTHPESLTEPVVDVKLWTHRTWSFEFVAV
ncbi:uncharacterized protein BJ171DRAFT_577539 [Polychytrium aggregatum]|uniref:uncharacterized protein n=1 Tax=Polychytrium aggregatum TaxID=110093 RepID=UPI0022FECB99|nr:uncharacterized protein BJ171DRAFT_577539 [Polychytrium aggregatum]KAI9208436.1 hypothetical protein BJ171DRAFT_577539 [Polychytrium aggregatum]